MRGSDSLTETTVTWPAVAQIAGNETVYVGLAVTSHTGPLPAEAKMSHVTVTGNVSPPGEFLWSEDIGFQMIMLPKKQPRHTPEQVPIGQRAGVPFPAGPC